MTAWPEVVYYAAVSVDGYIVGAGSLDAGHEAVFAAHYASVDALLMGSHTYQQLSGDGLWRYPGKPALVLSQRTLAAVSADVRIAALSVDDALDSLAADGVRRVWLVGGGALASSVLSAGAMTELDLQLVPEILGQGVQLFAGGSQPRRLQRLPWNDPTDASTRLRYRVLASAAQPPGGSGKP